MKEYKSPEFEEVKYLSEDVLTTTGEKDDNASSDLDDIWVN